MSVGTYPTHQVDFAPGIASSAVPAAGDWVEVTAAVFEWSVKWGTEDEFKQPGAGTGDLLLDNSDGDWDTDYSSGPYFGDLLPGAWFRIRAGTTSITDDVFYGQVSQDGFQVAASQYPDSVVHVRLVDAAEFLANTDLPESVYQVEVEEDSPALWWKFTEESGTQATDSSGNGRHGTYGGDATANSTEALVIRGDGKAIAFDGVDDIVTFQSYTLGNAWSVEFWIDAAAQAGEPAAVCLLTNSGTYAGGIIIYEEVSSSDKLRYLYLDPTSGNITEYESTQPVFDGLRHHICITQSGSTTNLYVDSFENKTLVSGAAQNITWPAMHVAVGSDNHASFKRHVAGIGAFLAGTIDDFAIYPTALSSAAVFDHYAEGLSGWGADSTSDRVTRILDLVGFPSSQRNIHTGQTEMQGTFLGGDAWSALVDIAKTENGAVYIDHKDAGKLRFIDRHRRWTFATSVTSLATIGDGGGSEVPADSIDLADDRIVNHAVMQRVSGAAVLVEDATSQTTYRKRSLSETGLLYDDDRESQHRAERVVAEKKDRHRRVRSFTFKPRKSTHPAWPIVFQININHRLTVKWRPTYGGTRSFDVWVSGIAHKWTHRDGLTSTFWCVPVPFDTTGAPYWIWDTSTWQTGTNVARWSY